MHVDMYVCMYRCTSVNAYVCIYGYADMYKCIYVYTYISIYVYMYVCIYVYMSKYICMYVYAYMCICVYVYIGFRIDWTTSGPFSRDPSAIARLGPPPILITARGSPSWHRRRRARRSRLRRTVKQHRLSGSAPPRRFLDELADHHSRPRYRELMGKQSSQKQWAGRWSGQPPWHGSASWGQPSAEDQTGQYWESGGAWNNQQPGAKGASKDSLFPKYSDVKIHAPMPSGRGANQAMSPSTGQDMDHIKEVQRLVNSIRRAEVKIRKNRETCHQKEVQWQEFQQQLKVSFMEQRSAYLRDKEHHRQEEAQFEDQKRSSVEQLKRLVNGGASAGGGNVERSATKEDAQAWLDFIADSKSEEEEELSDPCLHAALHAASIAGEAGVQAYKQQVNAWLDKQEAMPQQLPSASTPQRRPAQSLPMTPQEKPASSTRLVACHRDQQLPILEADGGGIVNLAMQMSDGHVPTFGTPPHRTVFGKAGERISVKSATMHPKNLDKKLRSPSRRGPMGMCWRPRERRFHTSWVLHQLVQVCR